MQELLMRIGSTISIISCLLVIIVYYKSLKLNKRSYNNVIFYIAICDTLSSIGGLLGISKSGSLKCSIQTLLTNIFPLSSIFWTTIISYILYNIIKCTKITISLNNNITSLIWIHLICWGIPIIVTLLPLTTETYGTYDGNDGWCFLEPGKNSWTYDFWVYVSFFGWVYLALIIYIVLIAYISFYASNSSTGQVTRSLINKILYKLIWYPIIILISWSIITAYILWDAYNPSSPALQNNTFIYFTFSVPLFSGFFTSVAFFFGSSEAKRCLYEMFRTTLKSICIFINFQNLEHQPILGSTTHLLPSSTNVSVDIQPGQLTTLQQQQQQQEYYDQQMQIQVQQHQHQQYRQQNQQSNNEEDLEHSGIRETEMTSSTE